MFTTSVQPGQATAHTRLLRAYMYHGESESSSPVDDSDFGDIEAYQISRMGMESTLDVIS